MLIECLIEPKNIPIKPIKNLKQTIGAFT